MSRVGKNSCKIRSMAERVQGISPKDITPKPAEFTLKNEEGLKELGFSDYEISGGRKLEAARKLLFEKPRSKSELKALKKWTEVKRADPTARKFQHLLEQAAALRRISKPEIREQATAYLQRALSLRAEAGPSGELLFSLGQALLGNELAAADPKVAKLLESLRAAETVEDRTVSPIEAVTSPNITLATRGEWWNRRIKPAVNFAQWLDRQKPVQEESENKTEGEPPEGESKPNEGDAGPQPPQRSKDHKPSMDDRQEAKEKGKETAADFTVTPGNKDFYEINSWQKWDGKKWTSVATDGEYKRKHKKGGLNAIVKGTAGNNETPIPLRRNGVVPKDSLDALRKQGFKITADSAGHLFVSSGKGKSNFEAEAAEGEEVKYSNWYKNLIVKPEIGSAPVPVRAELDRIMTVETKVLGRAKAWQKFVKKWLTYANDSKWNGVYQQAPDYFSAVGGGRMADCDVANTFFLLGCAKMGIDGELVGGYAVQKLDGTDAKLTPNDLHAVSRIFDPETKELVVFDATPPDPSKKDEGQRTKDEGEKAESEESERKDVDEQEEGDPLDEIEKDVPDEKELKKMELEIETKEQAEKEAAGRKIEAEEFARDVGCSEKEAQEVLDEIREAMDMTGEGDSRIIDRLLDQFKRLIQELTIPRSTAMPSVPRSMGEELVNPVEAFVSARAGSLDPTGFSREREIQDKIKHFGGFRLVIVNDRSGSTGEQRAERDKKDPTKWRSFTVIKEERRVNFLVLEALELFGKLARQQQSTMAPPPLNIETQILGFPGDYKVGPVTVIKPLSTELTNKDRLATHRALSTSGGGTPDYKALQWIREQLTPQDKKRLKEKDLLMIVIVNADGGSDSPNDVRRELGLLTEMGVIVKGRGLGKSVTEIVQTYAPHGSCGDIDTYPEFVGDEIIQAVKQLAPKRVGRVS